MYEGIRLHSVGISGHSFMTYAKAAAVLVYDHHRKETPTNSVFSCKKKKLHATDCSFIRLTPKYWADLDCCACRVERSTDQVMKPVNTDALSTWVGHIPSDVMSDMAEIAPMLARLGYDPHANPPDYSRPHPMASPFNHSQVSLQQKRAEVAQTSGQKYLFEQFCQPELILFSCTFSWCV